MDTFDKIDEAYTTIKNALLLLDSHGVSVSESLRSLEELQQIASLGEESRFAGDL